MIRLILLAGLIWLAHTYAAVTPIADLGILRIPATAAVVAVLLVGALIAIFCRVCRDTPARPRPARRERETA